MINVDTRKNWDGNDIYIKVTIDAADISLYDYELIKNFNRETGDVTVNLMVRRENTLESIRHVHEKALQYACDAQEDSSSD